MARRCFVVLAILGLLPHSGCQCDPMATLPTGTCTGLDPWMPAPTELSATEAAKVCFATAETLEQGGQVAEAINLYEQARAKDPRMLQATRRLAVLYDRIGQFDRAVDEYAMALKQNPHDPDVYCDMGYSYYCRGEWAKAENALYEALELSPKLERGLINMGMTLGQQGRYQESLAYFERAVTPAQARCNLAFILLTQGKTAEARRNYEQALALEPSLALARATLAQLGPPPQASVAQSGKARAAITPLAKTETKTAPTNLPAPPSDPPGRPSAPRAGVLPQVDTILDVPLPTFVGGRP